MKYFIGEKAQFSKTISESDVYTFAGISGDFNFIHINDVAAEKSLFGRKIAHGMLVASFISNVLGNRLPGEGTVYLEQNLKFIKPVYIGDTVTAEVVVAEILNEQKGIIKLLTNVKNQQQETVLNGYAIVKADM